MEPIEFPEVNLTLAKNQPPFLPLPVHKGEEQVISCWKLSPSEVELIGRTRKIFVSQMNYGKPPMALFLAVSKKEIFSDVEEQVEPIHEFGITHNATIKFGFWECLRMMLGKTAQYSATINCDREFRIASSPNGHTYVAPFFEKKMLLSSIDHEQVTN